MKKVLFAFVIFQLLTNSSYSFTGKEHELYLCSIYQKYDYNHYTYYLMLDTLQSRINVYCDDYGKMSLNYFLEVCPDSSIIYNTMIEGNIRINIKNGLIRNRTYMEDGGVEYLVYDKDNHLTSIKNEMNSLTFIWQNDSLIEHQANTKMANGSSYIFYTCHVYPETSCHAIKSPELFCRLYKKYMFNEILLSMVGLYGECPVTHNNYSIVEDDISVNSEHYIKKTMVANTYNDKGLLLETHSISRGYEYIQRFNWNIDNINRIFDFRSKVKATND